MTIKYLGEEQNSTLTIIIIYGTFLDIPADNIGGSAMAKLKKIPIQIYLEPDQDKIIGFLSRERGQSKAAIVRLCISKYLESLPAEKDPALGNMKLGASGRKDIAEKHDAYLTSFGT
jgi:hypothetical protein